MADKIQNAYETSKNIYDDVLTQGSIFSKLYIKLFWGGTDDNKIAEEILSYISNDFNGKLLDVPVGTAVFTASKWASLTNARITCLDYSKDMIEQAEKKGIINKNTIIVEPTSGNQGIGLALVGAVKGYKTVIII